MSPADGIQIRPATVDDDGEIFTLQRAAFVDEARLYDTPYVPSLDETFDELSARLRASTSWVALAEHRLVGAVSVRSYEGGVPHIERLMVAPDLRGTGISRQLLDAAERHARNEGHQQLHLIVGDLATDNRAIYAHLGWQAHSSGRLAGYDHVVLHTLTKRLT